jgi:nicotinate-nucleotide pyrophosphorylase (carboxylating)
MTGRLPEKRSHSLIDLVRRALEEDIGPGDITSLACLEPDPVEAVIVAKAPGVLSGLKPALLAFALVDSANSVSPQKRDGESFVAGDTIVTIKGFNQTVLVSERVALNFLAHLSGVATLTRDFVRLVEGTGCRVLDTRKTTPGLRLLEKEAVVHGGGANHRMGLYDMVLIKDNHIAAAGSVRGAIERTREYLGSVDFRLQFEADQSSILVEVEVTSLEQLREAIDSGVDRLLLDNQTPESLTEMVRVARSLNPEIELEASGNVSLVTVGEIAATGVDYVSIGALTHSAPASDFSLRVIG